MVGDSDRDERLPLAESIDMMREIGLLDFAEPTVEPAPSPQTVVERIQQARGAYSNRGLIDDSSVVRVIDQFDKDTSGDLRQSLEQQIRSAINTKYGFSFDEAFTYTINQITRLPILDRVFQRLGGSLGEFSVACRAGDRKAVRLHLGNIDLLFTLMTDFSQLLQQKPCTESLSPARFINLTSCAEAELDLGRKNGTPLPRGETGRGENVDFGHSVVITVTSYERNSVGQSIVQLVKEVFAYWQQEMQICVSVTKSSATALKSYLNGLGINRLYLPIANAGYFARTMMDAGMPATCSDSSPPKVTFTKVKKSLITESIRQFSKTLATVNQSIAAAVLTLDAPPPTFLNMSVRQSAGAVFPEVIKTWFEQGGRYLLVISEMTDIDMLFDPEKLNALSIGLEPVSPGFTPDIYLGLGGYIGICGVYRIHGKDCQGP